MILRDRQRDDPRGKVGQRLEAKRRPRGLGRATAAAESAEAHVAGRFVGQDRCLVSPVVLARRTARVTSHRDVRDDDGRRGNGRAEEDALRIAPLAVGAEAEREVPIVAPRVQLARTTLAGVRALDRAVVQVERGQALIVHARELDLRVGDQRPRRRKVGMVECAVQGRPTRLDVAHVDVGDRTREQRLDVFESRRIRTRHSQMQHRPAEPVEPIELGRREARSARLLPSRRSAQAARPLRLARRAAAAGSSCRRGERGLEAYNVALIVHLVERPAHVPMGPVQRNVPRTLRSHSLGAIGLRQRQAIASRERCRRSNGAPARTDGGRVDESVERQAAARHAL